jgi:hypothetical protein
VGSVGAVVVAPLRAWFLRWGASDQELDMALPGDELVARADLTATRAITIHADTEAVWPWIAQLGQGRGGFYSYDVLENLMGCDIHSADRIVPEWQSITVGANVNLHPDVALTAALVQPGRALVLRGAVPVGRKPPPYDFTWAFVLSGKAGGPTRLVVRERYGYTRWWTPLLVEPVALISFVMSRRMMRGIKHRAQRAVDLVGRSPVSGVRSSPPWTAVGRGCRMSGPHVGSEHAYRTSRPRGRFRAGPRCLMIRGRTLAAALGRGAAFHLGFSAVALGALTVWAHYCAAHKLASRP